MRQLFYAEKLTKLHFLFDFNSFENATTLTRQLCKLHWKSKIPLQRNGIAAIPKSYDIIFEEKDACRQRSNKSLFKYFLF